jgi:vancomycin resistance protein VanW
MDIVKALKLRIKIWLRMSRDISNGNYFNFAKKRNTTLNFEHAIKLIQEIKPSETFDNKIFNLDMASRRISQFIILPNEIFSFWKSVGNPNNGFKKGRTIINGTLSEEIGGGLCQVSGIIYHLSLLSGLEILERSNHSMDIYTEETRFTPLGTDATVVYGYKDLRVRNNYTFPIKFQLDVVGHTLEGCLLSIEQIEKKKILFNMISEDKSVTVNVMDESHHILNQSIYKK